MLVLADRQLYAFVPTSKVSYLFFMQRFQSIQKVLGWGRDVK